MFFPRFITLAVTLFCALVALNLFEGTWAIPLPFLNSLTILAAGIFATSGMVMFIGSFGIQMTPSGPTIDETSYLGKMMAFVIKKGGANQEELHCCDIYIASTKVTAIALLWLAIVLVALAAIIKDLWAFLVVVGMIVGVIAAVGGILWVSVYISDRRSAREAWVPATEKPAREVSPTLAATWKWVGWIVAGATIILLLVASVYCLIILPILAMMALGYTLLVAAGIYLLSLTMIGFPLVCIGGKQLIRRTGALGDRLCPIVRRVRR